jgi:hypothetical protein
MLVVPGSGFGGPGNIRRAYCGAGSVIEKAMPGCGRVMKKYQAKPRVEGFSIPFSKGEPEGIFKAENRPVPLKKKGEFNSQEKHK